MKTWNKVFFSTYAMKKIVLLFSAFMLLVVTVRGSLSFIVTGTPSFYNIFVNGLNPNGNLTICKTIEHPFGDEYRIPDDIVFTFDIDLGAENALKSFDGISANEYGVLTVQVKANGFVTIHDIPAKTEAIVTEKMIPEGFFVKDEMTQKKVIVEKGETSTVEFVNVYQPREVQFMDLSITGVKELTGREWQEGDSFTFELEQYDNGNWTKLGTETITYHRSENEDSDDFNQEVWLTESGVNRFDFSELIQNISFSKAGVYSFRVVEIEGSIEGITYDEAESYFDIWVGDADMDGYLEIQKIDTSSANTQVIQNGETKKQEIRIVFRNQYAPVGSGEAVIRIKKILEDTSGQNRSPDGFVFELYDKDGTLYETSEATSAAGETSIRLIVNPEDVGKTFVYTLREKNSGETINGITYDGKEVKLRVAVVDNLDGTVRASICDYSEKMALENTVWDIGAETVISEETSNIYEVESKNTYRPQNASVSISGDKDLIGRTMKEGEFCFNLYKTESDFVVSKDAVPVDTALNGDKDGTFSFMNLVFDKVGTYYYVVNEDSSARLGGVSYDDSRYFVTIYVTDNGGVLSVAMNIMNEMGTESEIKFCNTYKPKKVTLTLSGKKTLIGKSLKAGEFAFKLYQATDKYESTGEIVDTVTNDSNGEFYFSGLNYETEGVYYYIVSEDGSLKKKNITYDNTVYGVKVSVQDDGLGQLILEYTIVEVGGGAKDSICFTNTYREEIPSSTAVNDVPGKDENNTSNNTGSENTTQKDMNGTTSQANTTGINNTSGQINTQDQKNTTKTDTTRTDATRTDATGTDATKADTIKTDNVKTNNAKTGDNSKVLQYAILMLVSIVGIILLLVFINGGRRKKD